MLQTFFSSLIDFQILQLRPDFLSSKHPLLTLTFKEIAIWEYSSYNSCFFLITRKACSWPAWRLYGQQQNRGIYGNQTPNYVHCFKGILTAASIRVPYKCRREFLQFCSFWLRLLEQHVCRCYIWSCVVPHYTFASFVMKTSSTLFSNCDHACHKIYHPINNLPVLEVPFGAYYSNTDKLLQQDLNFILKLGLCLHSFRCSLLEKSAFENEYMWDYTSTAYLWFLFHFIHFGPLSETLFTLSSTLPH